MTGVRALRTVTACVPLLAAAPAYAQCDPLETQTLTASDGDALDRFGISVDIDADASIVGAYLDEPAGAGSAYVFERDGASWAETSKLQPPGAGGWFGVSVGVSGDAAIVGAQLSDIAAQDAGAAHVFRRNAGGEWLLEQTLLPSDAAAFDWLGHAVAIDGDAAIASAQLHDAAGQDAGAAYVFRFDGGAGVEEAMLAASDGGLGDEFGTSVDVRGDLAIVGARFADQVGSNAGAAYVFRRIDGAWVEEAVLLADDGEAGDEFGFDVAIQGDRAIVGARLDDDAGTDAGAAYVFEHGGDGVWTQAAKLVAAETAADDRLGESVALEGDLALAGARLHDGAGADAGAAFLFRREAGGGWVGEATLVSETTEPGDFLGIWVALTPTDAIAGANLSDQLGDQSGSATVFSLNCADACAADCDGNGELNVLDFICFQNEWAAQTDAGDCDDSGAYDVLDFICFQQRFAEGCR